MKINLYERNKTDFWSILGYIFIHREMMDEEKFIKLMADFMCDKYDRETAKIQNGKPWNLRIEECSSTTRYKTFKNLIYVPNKNSNHSGQLKFYLRK